MPLFAAVDYIFFKKRWGRFARVNLAGWMAYSFEGSLPQNAIDRLSPGDLLFVESFDSFQSWLVLYFSHSDVSHVAMYLGDETIAHATEGGVLVQPLEALYHPSRRILPCIWHMTPRQRVNVAQEATRLIGTRYGFGLVGMKAFRILVGRDWPYFRWSFLFDSALVIAALYLLVPSPFANYLPWLWIGYLCAVLSMATLWRIRRFPPAFNGKPNDFLSFLIDRKGCDLIANPAALAALRTKYCGRAR